MAQDWPNNVRLWVIVRVAQRAAANAALHTIFPEDPPGADEFLLQLVPTTGDPTVTPTAAGCGIQITPNQRNDLLAACIAQGFRARESTVIDPGGTPRLTDNLWIFNGGTEMGDPGFWTFESAQAALNLRPWVDPTAEV